MDSNTLTVKLKTNVNKYNPMHFINITYVNENHSFLFTVDVAFLFFQLPSVLSFLFFNFSRNRVSLKHPLLQQVVNPDD